ncbi:MAG: hypothetical protein ACI85O_000602 [Saprospiraceae bacterium]|jgi:hypothetical protein
MTLRILLLLFLIGNGYTVRAQLGCTDPQASNYDENALTNDGSCLYSATDYLLTQEAVMPDELEENSGLAFFNNTLWTHTDAAGEDKLYRIDTLTAEITKEVIIATANNIDWEELAESETHVFIGDFGNNDGNRTDLRIFRVSKSDLENETVVNADLIEFSYADQTDFTLMNNANDYDCEAFFYLDGNLHLFSKNWVDFQTRHYVIPAEPGTYEAQVIEEFPANCLITAADIDEEGTIVLLGYTTAGTNILWLFFDYPVGNILGGNKRRISLGNSLNNSQTEGIVFSGTGRGFIGAEEFSVLPARLLKFETKQWTTNNMTSINDISQQFDYQYFPNPTNDLLTVSSDFVMNKIELRDKVGRLVFTEDKDTFETQISMFGLPRGMYFLRVVSEGKSGVRKVAKN